MVLYKESDWKLFRTLLPKWQEKYIAKINKEYIKILNQDKNASTNFWELYDRIKKDRYNPGVIIELKKSMLIDSVISLIKYKVISFEELNDFSDEFKETIERLIQ